MLHFIECHICNNKVCSTFGSTEAATALKMYEVVKKSVYQCNSVIMF